MLCRLVIALLTSPASNTVVDFYSKASIDKPTLLVAMQDSFGLCYEVIKTSISVNATGNKPHYYSLKKKAVDFGYKPTISSMDGLLKGTRMYMQLCNM